MREIEKAEINRMQNAEAIEPAFTKSASPAVLVPRKDGRLRFCVIYRHLNAVTVSDSSPVPRMDNCIDSLGRAAIFTTLQCKSGYRQIEIIEADRNRTKFTPHSGLFHFIWMAVRT